jgi:hypothetical protein
MQRVVGPKFQIREHFLFVTNTFKNCLKLMHFLKMLPINHLFKLTSKHIASNRAHALLDGGGNHSTLPLKDRPHLLFGS